MDPPSPSQHRVAHIQPRRLNPNLTQPKKDRVTLGHGETPRETPRETPQDTLRETPRDTLRDTPRDTTRPSVTAPRRTHTPPRSPLLPPHRKLVTSQVPASTRESSNSTVPSSSALNSTPRSNPTARSLSSLKVVQDQGEGQENNKGIGSQGEDQEVVKVVGAQGQVQSQGGVKVIGTSDKVVAPSENTMKKETRATSIPHDRNGNGPALQSTMGGSGTNGSSASVNRTSVSARLLLYYCTTGATHAGTGTPPASCDNTPTSCDTTPTSCDTTPTSCDTTPASCDTTLASCDTTPASCDTTPTSCDTTPTSCDTTPASCDTTPASCDTTLASCDTTPASCDTTPVSFDTTPDNCDSTLASCDTTRASCDATPASCDTTLASCDTTPAGCDTTPVSCDTSPDNCDTTLASCDTTPTSCDTTPVSYDTTPDNCDTTLASCDTTPTSCDTTPASCDTTPVSYDTTPDNCDTTLASCDTTPTSCDTTPASCDTTPASCDTTPISCDTTPISCDTTPANSDTNPISCDTTSASCDTTSTRCDITPAICDITPTSCDTTPASTGTTTGGTSTSSTTGTKTTPGEGGTQVKPSMTSLLAKKKKSWLKAIKSAKGDRQLNQVTRSSDVEEVIFNLLDEQGQVSVAKFWNVIKWSGLWHRDPRLRECRDKMTRMSKATHGVKNEADIVLDKDSFKKCISDNIWVIGRVFKKDLIIPEFRGFTEELEKIFLRCKENDAGQIPDSVPQLAVVDRDLWGVTVCTIDGQRAAFGDSSVPFCLESCAMPFNYALAVTELGADDVHKWVGFEPSGSGSNDLSLNHDRKPYNPLVNSGAIVILSMLRAGQCPANRFDYLFKSFKKLAGHEYIGFNNAVYLSEKDNSDRNYAICYNLQENGCTPGTPLLDTLDFHFQMGSVEITAESGAVMAATLANGGICPITCQRVLTTDAVRDTLSLMHCCGMYDYSGHFAFTVGLPAKSGMGGGIMLVIPHVMGICCYAPLVDNHGNSVRGLQFCEELVKVYTFHNYESMGGSATKIDPCMRDQESSVTSVVKLLYGASVGDISTIRRFALSGMDMSSTNYDGRTALHVAAAHGHLDIVKMLIERCSVIHDIKDRYGNAPIDGARRFARTAIVEYLLEEHERQKPTSIFAVLTKAMQSAKAAAAMPAPVTSSAMTSPAMKSSAVTSIIHEEGVV